MPLLSMKIMTWVYSHLTTEPVKLSEKN